MSVPEITLNENKNKNRHTRDARASRRISKKTSEHGAVTFLDVLGWKGIWQQEASALDTLHGLVQETITKADEISAEYSNVNEFRGKKDITKVISISDTIAMFTTGPAKPTIEIHARVCAWLLEYALKQKIPMRGAISYGEYMVKDNIMLGYAVDEAASWHESTNWIGVVLSPTAEMRTRKENISAVTIYAKIPYKNRIERLSKCVDWSYQNDDELYDIIYSKGPHSPEIAPKYLNTLQFLEREREIMER